jgi:hypothetical protein
MRRVRAPSPSRRDTRTAGLDFLDHEELGDHLAGRAAGQIAVATLAVAAFYVAMWGRDSPTVMETPTAAAKPSSARPTGPPNGSNAVDAAPLTAAPLAAAPADVAAPLTAAPRTAAPLAAAPADGSNAVPAAPLGAAPVSFPRPRIASPGQPRLNHFPLTTD